MLRAGPLLGARQLGASVYELPPGQAICPYHYEYGEEEWLLVLAGRPTLRHPGGEDVLEPLDLVAFPTGPEGAHAVRNATGETVRVLMFSTVVAPDSDRLPGQRQGRHLDRPQGRGPDGAAQQRRGLLRRGDRRRRGGQQLVIPGVAR